MLRAEVSESPCRDSILARGQNALTTLSSRARTRTCQTNASRTVLATGHVKHGTIWHHNAIIDRVCADKVKCVASGFLRDTASSAESNSMTQQDAIATPNSWCCATCAVKVWTLLHYALSLQKDVEGTKRRLSRRRVDSICCAQGKRDGGGEQNAKHRSGTVNVWKFIQMPVHAYTNTYIKCIWYAYAAYMDIYIYTHVYHCTSIDVHPFLTNTSTLCCQEKRQQKKQQRREERERRRKEAEERWRMAA